MGQIKIEKLSDIKSGLPGKLQTVIKDQSVIFQCTKCGKSTEAFSFGHWIGKKSWTCRKEDCGEANDINIEKIETKMREIGNM